MNLKINQLFNTDNELSTMLPEPRNYDNEKAKYYLVYHKTFGWMQAMFLRRNNTVNWYTNYSSVVENIEDIILWVDLPNIEQVISSEPIKFSVIGDFVELLKNSTGLEHTTLVVDKYQSAVLKQVCESRGLKVEIRNVGLEQERCFNCKHFNSYNHPTHDRKIMVCKRYPTGKKIESHNDCCGEWKSNTCESKN